MFSWLFKPKSIEQIKLEEEIRQRQVKEAKEEARLQLIADYESKLHQAVRQYEAARGAYDVFVNAINGTGRISLYDKENMVKHSSIMQAAKVDVEFYTKQIERAKSIIVK